MLPYSFYGNKRKNVDKLVITALAVEHVDSMLEDELHYCSEVVTVIDVFKCINSFVGVSKHMM